MAPEIGGHQRGKKGKQNAPSILSTSLPCVSKKSGLDASLIKSSSDSILVVAGVARFSTLSRCCCCCCFSCDCRSVECSSFRTLLLVDEGESTATATGGDSMAAAPTLISLVVGVLVASLFAASAAFLFLVVGGVVNVFFFLLFLLSSSFFCLCVSVCLSLFPCA